MKTKQITMVRVYLTEGHAQLDSLMRRMHDWEKVRGLTVFRGITGFGESGTVHTAKWIDLAMDLPIVVEFFDEPSKVEEILEHLQHIIKPGHMTWWSANTHEAE